MGEAAPAAFPVPVSIEGHGTSLLVSVDGQTHAVDAQTSGGWRGIIAEQPSVFEREYQIDGSDTTSTLDRQPAVIAGLLGTPVYGFDAWLRDESSYSRWEHLRVVDLSDGSLVDANADAPLPHDFRIDAALRRPEGPARLWLVGSGANTREGLELNRDQRNARWVVQRNGERTPLPRWFFPEQPAPFAAELLHLLGRSVAAALVLAMIAWAIARVSRNWIFELRLAHRFTSESRWLRDTLLAAWLLAAALVSARLYHQLPHILDSVSYTFQAGLFASGKLALDVPPLVNAFKGPFEVVAANRVFSQYPPGAPAIYAIGRVLHVEWIVGPVCCVILIAATSGVARMVFGSGTALLVLICGVLSPFVLFQSGSFLSHPVVGGLLAAALFAFVKAETRGDERWYYVSGALLGIAFTARETASVLFAIPLGVRLIRTRNVRALSSVAVAGVPFLVLYLAYNQAVTGSLFVLPRQLFDPSDRFGFGDGIGFHTRHTLAAGLANTDELLTDLQFEFLGWPPLCALGVLLAPFLLRRPREWDLLAALGFLVFVVAYVGYFYHGIALGPRYYFEAMPWLLLLAARGISAWAEFARSRLAAGVVVGALFAYALLFYVPLEVQRRTDLSGMPSALRLNPVFVQSTLFGPQANVPQTPALVTTNDWWVYNTALAALNCPTLPDCVVLYALATSSADETRLRLQFPGRVVFHAQYSPQGTLTLVPSG